MLWALQRSVLYRLLDLIELKCKVTHSATNSQLETHLKLVNLAKKDARAHLQAPSQGFQGFLVLFL